MYLSIAEFIEDWKNETQATQKIFNALTDASLNLMVYPEGRTLGIIAWHIVKTLGEMIGKTGIVINCPDENSDEPTEAAVYAETYTKLSEELITEVETKWNDAMLADILDMYGEKWSRNQVLQILVRHEIHHRAQITILMRQAGLKVPGLYGPAKEEWESYGMPSAK
jgi:uncharacterized damage-inducible protein DinB